MKTSAGAEKTLTEKKAGTGDRSERRHSGIAFFSVRPSDFLAVSFCSGDLPTFSAAGFRKMKKAGTAVKACCNSALLIFWLYIDLLNDLNDRDYIDFFPC